MTRAYINHTAVAVPDNDVHEAFVHFAEGLLCDRRSRLLFDRMVKRSGIKRRWSCVDPSDGFYVPGRFPSTGQRMSRYAAEAPALAQKAVDRLGLGDEICDVSHLIVTSCTGMSAPGVDLELVRRCGLDPGVERTIIGFMGCNAAINALRLARHIVRSTLSAKVLIVSLELCTLHLQETEDIERLLSFLLFGDGCAAALVSAEPMGLALDGFHAELVPDAADQVTWTVGDMGFDMFLSGKIPATIAGALRGASAKVLAGTPAEAFGMWAVHPGGRTVLDAVEDAFSLGQGALAVSRAVLRDHGNMSSATVLFVLDALMRDGMHPGGRGCAMAFGPGLTAETMLFRTAA
jgi:predicted naringenin-chalcone synthase